MIGKWRVGFAVLTASTLVAACGSSGGPVSTRSVSTSTPRVVTASIGTPVSGGTAYWAEQPLSPPNYIFPLVSGAYYSNENVNEFQTLMYRPLYWYGDRDRPGVDYPLSLGDAPVYSDHDRVVTITLKRARWSDAEPVSARDVVFWINLLKANRADWASYVPGGFPDNVASFRAVGPRSVRLRLNRSYNPIWFTNNELSQITPLPMAWDRAPPDPSFATPKPSDAVLPDTTMSGAKAVYRFLNAQAKELSNYADSPIWSIVDGPWKLQSLTASGEATFVPNPKYDGPDRPHLASFVELPFTSEAAEFSVLKAGSATGDRGGSAPQVSVGYVPDNDVPQAVGPAGQGYRLTDFHPFGFDYFEPNFNNPDVGAGAAAAVFPPSVPAPRRSERAGSTPTTRASVCRPTARCRRSPRIRTRTPRHARIRTRSASRPPERMLTAHGWNIVANGASSCQRRAPGWTSAVSGIRRGKPLHFTLMYPGGVLRTDGSMIDLQSVASEVGIEISLDEVTQRRLPRRSSPAGRVGGLRLATRQLRKPGCSSPTITRPARRSSRPARSVTSAAAPIQRSTG